MEEQGDENERRAYWAQKMDEAYAFMLKASALPAHESGEPLGSLVDAAGKAGVEVEFSTKPHVHGLPRLYLLREALIPNFIAAAHDMNEHGWVMRVEDGFRSREMQKHIAREPYVFDIVLERVLWELEGSMPSSEFMFRRLSALVAASPQVGTHMSGSAIDISVLDRDSRRELDRGGPYLELSELTPMDSPFVLPQAHENRMAITALMEAHGFVAYPWEFWHYNSGDVYEGILHPPGKPARYGPIDIDPESRTVVPIQDPTTLLNSLDEIQHALQIAFKRRALNEAAR